MSRLATRFAALAAEGRAGLVSFITSGDPDPVRSDQLLFGLPAAGADIVELGMPFSDPMADGPAIQAASLRALKGGWSLRKTLDQVRRFRLRDDVTPIVLMGYYNPIYRYRIGAFLADAKAAGVDGLIVVDLPPEEEIELALPAKAMGIDFIYLTAPTTDDVRLPRVMRNASGFVYYVSVTGVTGARSAEAGEVATAVARLRRHTALPIAVGFGIKTPVQAAAMARHAEAVVVGSALVARLAENLDGDPVGAVLNLTRDLAQGVRTAREQGENK